MAVMTRAARGLRVLVGATIGVLAALPVYRWIAAGETGLAGRIAVGTAAREAAILWSGTLVLALVGVLAGLFLPADAASRVGGRLSRALRRPPPRVFALLVGALAFGVTAAFTLLVMDGKPVLVDAMAQLVQARYLADGHVAGPVLEYPGFWFIQNMVLSGGGWVSQYPPGHTALLAAGMLLGAVELVGAGLMAVTAAVTYLALRRLLPEDDEGVARVAGIGVALSPVLVAQAGTYMSHGSAAAFSVLAVYFALRARDGRALWALALGAALGVVLTSRPLFALVTALGAVVPMAVAAGARGSLSWSAVRVRIGLAVLGGAPFVLLLMVYNTALFGGPWDLGYVLAWGESVGLGFHRDPWGNVYSPVTALGYTSADLVTLSLQLFETPLPLVALAGLWLAAARRLRPGEGILFAWALAPVAANFFYWHHSYFMGPRMLAEAVPAWAGVGVLVVARFLAWLPETLPEGAPRFRPRTALGTAVVLAVVAAGYFAPMRLLHWGEASAGLRIESPPVPTAGPALVFVHGGWGGRIRGRLAAERIPVYAIEAAIRQNDLCRVQEELDRAWFDPAALDLDPRPMPPALVDVQVYPGHTVTLARSRLSPDGDLALSSPCARQARSDRGGVMDIAPLLWRGALPGLEPGGVMYVRDLGPESNERLLRHHPGHGAWALLRDEATGRPVVLPYEEGMRRLWPPPAPGDAATP